MRTVLLLLVVMVVAVSVWGCRSVEGNARMFAGDTIRFAGLDRPSWLHPRVHVPENYYTPYR